MGDPISWSVAADRRFRRLLLLSVLLHVLVLALLTGRRGQEISPSGATGQRKSMQVTLSKPRKAAKAPADTLAQQPVPKPVTKSVPKQVPREPPKAKPQTKPTERLAVRKSPHPAPRKLTPPQPPVPEFRDEFSERSRTYSRADIGGESASAEPKGDSSLGISPGSIANINPRIVYPRQAQMRRYEGVVVVLIHIATDGSARKVDLLRSSGYAELDDAVLGAVQHWQFIPPRRGHMPVESTFKHTVVFGAEERVDDFEYHWREIRLMPAS